MIDAMPSSAMTMNHSEHDRPECAADLFGAEALRGEQHQTE